MGTKENRARHDRCGLRYESDLSNDEWAEMAPLILPAKPGGNKCSVDLREVVNGRCRPAICSFSRSIPASEARRISCNVAASSGSLVGAVNTHRR